MAVDQGWVNGRNSIPGQRYLLEVFLGLRTLSKIVFIWMPLQVGALIAPDSIKKRLRVTGF